MGYDMKVLIIAGHSRSLVDFRGPLIARLRREGHIVHAAAPDLHSDAVAHAYLSDLGVTTHDTPVNRTGLNPIDDIRYFIRVLMVVRQVQPDSVLTYAAKPVIWGSVAAAVSRVPNRTAMITGLGHAFIDVNITLRDRFVRFALGLLYKTALSLNDNLILQNNDDYESLREIGAVHKRNRVTITAGSGVDLSRFNLTTLPERPVFLMAARLLISKGVRDYVSAALKLKSRYPEAEFLLAGWTDGDRRSVSPAELSNWNEQGIKFLGRLDDIRPAIERCLVYVLPSYYREGVPKSVLEAMSMGRAIITTDAPGCRETVIHDFNGILIPPRDAESLASAMELFMGDIQLAHVMGANSRILARERFDVDVVNDKIIDTISY